MRQLPDLHRSSGIRRTCGSHRVAHGPLEAGRDVAAKARLDLTVEHEALQPDLLRRARLAALHEHLRLDTRRREGAQGRGRTRELGDDMHVELVGRRQQQLAGGIADIEVETHDVLARERGVGDRDLGAVAGPQHEHAEVDRAEAAFDAADAQVVADAIATLEPEHQRMKHVAQPGQGRDDEHADDRRASDPLRVGGDRAAQPQRQHADPQARDHERRPATQRRERPRTHDSLDRPAQREHQRGDQDQHRQGREASEGIHEQREHDVERATTRFVDTPPS